MSLSENGSLYKCNKCGAINEYWDGYIYNKSENPREIGCDCVGSTYTETLEIK